MARVSYKISVQLKLSGERMKTTLMLGVLSLFALAPCVFAQDKEDGAEQTKGIQWTEDYQGALKTATAEKKRLFIEFTATW
jgi:hypothetical protein